MKRDLDFFMMDLGIPALPGNTRVSRARVAAAAVFLNAGTRESGDIQRSIC